MTIERRAFMTGVASVAVAAALPAVPEPFIGLDLAAPDSERAAIWIIESTPGGSSYWFEMLLEAHRQIKETCGIPEEYLHGR